MTRNVKVLFVWNAGIQHGKLISLLRVALAFVFIAFYFVSENPTALFS